jgi:hypothetical protein
MDEAQAIREIVGSRPIYCKVCKVCKVEALTCDVNSLDNPEVTITEVRLKSHLNGDESIIIKPKNDSYVIVGFLSRTDAFIAMYDEVEEIDIKISETTLHIDKDGIIINEGKNGGMTITPELKTQLEKTNELLDALIEVISGSPILEPGNNANSALQTALNGAIAGKTLGAYDDIENDKVKH